MTAWTNGRIYIGSFDSQPAPSRCGLSVGHALHEEYYDRSGTSGFTSVTALSKSLTTWSVPSFPIDLISFNFSSVSLFASSSAFLLPLDCYSRLDVALGPLDWWNVSHLFLVCLELIILLLLVLFNLLLRLALGLLHAFRPVCHSSERVSFGEHSIRTFTGLERSALNLTTVDDVGLPCWTIFCASRSACYRISSVFLPPPREPALNGRPGVRILSDRPLFPSAGVAMRLKGAYNDRAVA